MDPQTVAARLDDVQLVDVRYESEWNQGHIEGSVNIPEEDFDARIGELDRGRPVVTVCRAGTRSADAAEWLRGEGFDASSLEGGMLAWKWAGMPISGRIVEPETKSELSTSDIQALHDEMIEIAFAVQQHFGIGVEPTERQIRGFLRERMIGEGKTAEEADAFLAEMGGE